MANTNDEKSTIVKSDNLRRVTVTIPRNENVVWLYYSPREVKNAD
jgi:hypothetical protein